MHILFITKYLPDHGLYMVVPVHNGKSTEQEYVFPSEEAQWEFICIYEYSPVAAMYAYQVSFAETYHG